MLQSMGSQRVRHYLGTEQTKDQRAVPWVDLLGCDFSSPSAPNSGEPETAREGAGGTERSQGRETARCPPQPGGVPARGELDLGKFALTLALGT